MIDRLARVLVDLAARRWPAELADEMAEEWHAELAALRADRRPWRSLAFAGSLALSPAVEAADEDPVTWPQRLAAGGRALSLPIALTLVAAALFNGVHVAQERFGPAAGGAALGTAAVVMALLGRRTTVGRVALLGATVYGFLLAGNRVAVMPFMGWIDIAPAVITWTALTALTVHASSRLREAGRGLLGAVTAAFGALIALDLAAVAGSLHAAATLGVGAGSAPLWFPLALLPGGTADFGTYFANGTAAFGSLQQVGPAFHASDILLGNASAMIGPLALCSAYLTAGLLRRAKPVHARRLPPIPSPALRVFQANRPPDAADRIDPRIPLGVMAALGGLAICEVQRRTSGAVDVTLRRLVDNSAVFGFGFLTHPAGRAAVALLAGLLVIRLGGPAPRPRDL